MMASGPSPTAELVVARGPDTAELHAYAWQPIHTALAAIRYGRGPAAVAGLADPFIITDRAGWQPASGLVGGEPLAAFLSAATRRWTTTPHAAATLAWKTYSYYAVLPLVLGWAAARRVPLLTAEATLIRFDGDDLILGAAEPAWAVLPGDPMAVLRSPAVRVLPTEEALLGLVRQTLLEQHLDPVLEGIRRRVRLGRRTLLGSVASGIAYALVRAEGGLPGSVGESASTLLAALELDDLVDVNPGPAGLTVQRHTCCLAFTLDPPKICSGCCIR